MPYYDEAYDEDNRLDRLQLERDLTWHYLDTYSLHVYLPT